MTTYKSLLIFKQMMAVLCSKMLLRQHRSRFRSVQPNSAIVRCNTTLSATNSSVLEAKYSCTRVGEHVVSASLFGCELAGSPIIVDVANVDVGLLDPGRCHK